MDGVHCSAVAGLCCSADIQNGSTRPIETANGYQQDGMDLERADMVEHLAHERESARHIARARTIGVVVVVLSTTGGALIGYPLGQKIGGSQRPLWALAYAGAGALALAVPLLFWEAASVGDAVDAHNRVTGLPDESALPSGPVAAVGSRPFTVTFSGRF